MLAGSFLPCFGGDFLFLWFFFPFGVAWASGELFLPVFWNIRPWNSMTDLVGLQLHSIYMKNYCKLVNTLKKKGEKLFSLSPANEGLIKLPNSCDMRECILN